MNIPDRKQLSSKQWVEDPEAFYLAVLPSQPVASMVVMLVFTKKVEEGERAWRIIHGSGLEMAHIL